MSICRETRERLPAIVAGEASSEGTREHLAACASCRGERDRLTRELERIQHELTALSPTPFLEEAVLADAAAEPAPAGPRIAAHWRWGAVAMAASLLLFLLVHLPGGTTPEQPSTAERVAGESATARAAPRMLATASELARARQTLHETGVSLDADEKLYIYKYIRKNGRIGADAYAQHPPRDSEALVRTVRYGGLRAPGRRTFSIGMPAEEGVALAGAELFEALGDLLVTQGQFFFGEERRRLPTRGSRTEFLISAPGGGPETRVRVGLSTAYTGSLLLPADLGRALDLQQYEIEGGFEIPRYTSGRRALARIRIPALGFDQVLEVQVKAARAQPRTPNPAWPDASARLWLEAEGSPIVMLGSTLSAVSSDENWSFVLDQSGLGQTTSKRSRIHVQVTEARAPDGKPHPTPAPRCFVARFDAAIDGSRPEAAALFQRTDFAGGPHQLKRVGAWIRFPTRLPEGTHVVLARVWHGTTPVPSAEPVIYTRVDKQGVVHAPRFVGEPISTMRMLALPADGEPSFSEVVVDADLLLEPEVDVRIIMTSIKALDYENTLFELKPRGMDGAVAMQVQGLDLLRRALTSLRKAAGQRPGAQPASHLKVWIHVAPTTPWAPVAAIMQTLAHPEVFAPSFGFVLAREDSEARASFELPWDMGVGGGAAPASERGRPITVRLVERNQQWELSVDKRLDARIESKNERVELAAGDVAGVEKYLPQLLGSAGQERLRAGTRLEISPAGPQAGYVQMGLIFTSAEVCRALGARDIVFSALR